MGRFLCKIKVSLYGMKDPIQLYKGFDSFMLIQSEYNHFVYFKNLENGIFMLNVDNMLVASQNMVEITRLKARVGTIFHMKDRGEVKQILGIEVHIDRRYGNLWLS